MHQLRGYTYRYNIGKKCSRNTLSKHLRQAFDDVEQRLTVSVLITHVSNTSGRCCRFFFVFFKFYSPQKVRILRIVPCGCITARSDPLSESFAVKIDPYTSIPSSSRLSALESRRRKLRRRNSLHQTDARFTRRLAEIGGGR